jgi:UDP-2-acetamido-3-amino-2,3-dideoxy-glucuronate N-acetyltransferase
MKVGKNTRVWHPDKSVILDCFIGDDCTIHAPVWIGPNVVIGDRCKIQAFAFIPEGVSIGSDVFIGPGVIFTNDPEPPSHRQAWKPIYVGNGAVIGAGAVIKAGVTIAPGAKIGCGAVVTKDVMAGDWYVSNPAKPIRRGNVA